MWPHLFIEGRRAVTGDGERPRYGLAFKKIFANGSKGIEQRAGLQADAAVHNPRPLIQRIAALTTRVSSPMVNSNSPEST